MMHLLTENDSPSELYAFRGKMQNNKRPSRFNFPVRGGKVNIICENHRNDPVHCCDNKNLKSAEMIMCEYCLLWYHWKCEELSGAALEEIENYKCSFC